MFEVYEIFQTTHIYSLYKKKINKKICYAKRIIIALRWYIKKRTVLNFYFELDAYTKQNKTYYDVCLLIH